ncbi:cytochrome P450 [Dentipellis sp. KUC8613]|nr:cytochrome P450 [Dentipellis sp. KUC8613]
MALSLTALAALALLAAVVVVVLFRAIHTPRTHTDPASRIPTLGGLPLLHGWAFFARRYDFIWDNLKRTRSGLFQFSVLRHKIFVLSGEDARQVFFHHRSLDAAEGYKIFLGSAPYLSDIAVEADGADDVGYFNKRLAMLFRRERLEAALPTLLDDVHARMEHWEEGMINPFDEIYDIVFQTTVRLATSRALAASPHTLQRMQALYWTMERSATPAALLLPSWVPSRARRAKARATRELYELVLRFVERCRERVERGTEGEGEEGGEGVEGEGEGADAIEVLIRNGDSDAAIVGFVLGVIFAGVINTGMNACWLLVFLAAHPAWHARIKAEIDALLLAHAPASSSTHRTSASSPTPASHSTSASSPAPDSEPLHRRLARVPLSAWETALPSLDLALRETLRLTLAAGTLLRRNVREDIPIGGGGAVDANGSRDAGGADASEDGGAGGNVGRDGGTGGDEDPEMLPRGAFLAYPIADSHLNEAFWDEPGRFDPSRFEDEGKGGGKGGGAKEGMGKEGKEGKGRAAHAFVGWGTGRHPCTGMRTAKLEMKLLCALFLASHAYALVDAAGRPLPPGAVPVRDRNDLQKARPEGGACWFRVRRVVE